MDVDMDSSGGNVALHEQEKVIKLHPVSTVTQKNQQEARSKKQEAKGSIILLPAST